MDQSSVDILSHAAEPFTISDTNEDSLQLDKKRDDGHSSPPPPAYSVSQLQDFWIQVEDVTDILCIANIKASDMTVGRAVRDLRNLLPGLVSKKLCFQVEVTFELNILIMVHLMSRK